MYTSEYYKSDDEKVAIFCIDYILTEKYFLTLLQI